MPKKTSSRHKNLPSGIWTALITPFDQKGQLDLHAFGDLVQWQIQQGVQGLVVCGSTGEAATLNDKERLQLLEVCLKHAADRVPVIVGAGSNDTRQAQALHKRMGQAGACATLQTVPWYNKPSQEGLYRHFSCIAESCDTPFFAYNIPARTGIDLHVETVLRLAKACPHMIGLKDANVQAKRLQFLIHDLALVRPDMLVLSGEDHFTLPLLALGGHGVVSVVSNVAPAEMVQLWQAWCKNDVHQAQRLAHRMTTLAELLFQQTNPMGVKTALHLMDRAQLTFRLPLCPPNNQQIQQLRANLSQWGLL
ncbi:MAG: 4-hydroxy-tetrahydrodipicolinate synthase [Myxococcota bacterium]